MGALEVEPFARADHRMTVDPGIRALDANFTVETLAHGHQQTADVRIGAGTEATLAAFGVAVLARMLVWLAYRRRLAGVTARGATLAAARDAAYAMVDQIDAPGLFCRRDIGWRAL